MSSLARPVTTAFTASKFSTRDFARSVVITSAEIDQSNHGSRKPKPGYHIPGLRTVDISDLRPTDTLIAVMGMTGAGKSTFIQHCTDAIVPVGRGLTSCTQEVMIYPYKSEFNRRVYLVDTPGFDDTDRTDTQVLKEIATWLTDTFADQVRLSGLIYLHRISDVRMHGSAKRNLFMFKKLCGPAAFKKVKLVTTMWEEHARNGEAREQELIDTHDFWGYMIDQGATTYRHVNTTESARELVGFFLEPANTETEKLELKIQTEMQSGVSLEDTSAGREVEIQLQEIKEQYLRELESIKADQKEALALRDKQSAEALEELQTDYNKKIENVNRGREQLRADMEKLHKDREQALIKRLQEQEDHVNSMKQQLEKASDEEKALLREQIETAKEANTQLQKQLTSIGQRIKRRAAIQIHGTGGKNRINDGCSLAVYDEYYVYIGAANSRSNYPPIADGLGLSHEMTMYFVFGQNNSWYRHYHHLYYCHDLLSPNFEENYPGFRERCLMQRKRSTCPRTVALGLDGEYFFADRDRDRGVHTLSKEHSDFLEENLTGDFARVRRLWLGLEGSLIFVSSPSKKLYCYNVTDKPDSVYPGLRAALEAKVLLNKRVKAIAMSLTDRTCSLAVWKTGHHQNAGQGNIDTHNFVMWCGMNQGMASNDMDKEIKESHDSLTVGMATTAVVAETKQPTSSVHTLPNIDTKPSFSFDFNFNLGKT